MSFTPEEWSTIETFLDLPDNAEMFGIPKARPGSLLFASWNIRKFGALRDEGGSLKRTAGATRMIERFCGRCDLIAIQEVMRDFSALEHLCEQLNQQGGDYDYIMSDVTGQRPGHSGAPERMAFLYNRRKIKIGRVGSDLTLDRSAVLENIHNAHRHTLEARIPDEADPGWFEAAKNWFSKASEERAMKKSLKQFTQFIRSPHLVEFIAEGAEGQNYEIYAVNAHLVSGKTKKEREREFFALLEWLLLDSPKTVSGLGKVYLLMADLNLDFKSSVSRRRKGIEDYVVSLNEEKQLSSWLNFPFLDHGFKTNARETETFDHIAFVADDTRWPRAEFNDQIGRLGADDYDIGMFNFVQAFIAAGPGRGEQNEPLYEKFEFDFTDHMPIWMRLPVPAPTQRRFE